MLKKLSLVALIALAGASAFAQEKTVTVADFVGTWNIEVMSHQVALVIEPQEGNKVTGTMMMMGRDVPLKGELAGRTHLVRRRERSRGACRSRARGRRQPCRQPEPGRECEADRRHAARRRHAERRDDDLRRSREVDRRKAEGEEEGLDGSVPTRSVEGSGSDDRASIPRRDEPGSPKPRRRRPTHPPDLHRAGPWRRGQLRLRHSATTCGRRQRPAALSICRRPA